MKYDGPYLDDWGDFFALVGEHRKLDFLRQWMYYTSMSLFDIADGREVWPNIRIVNCRIVDRLDESTWHDGTREEVEDSGHWPFEWDLFMELDKDGPIVATVYTDGTIYNKDGLHVNT